MPLYTLSSTILGSTIMRRTSSGAALYSREIMSELVHTDLPEPVVPAMSIWGSLAMLPTMALPPMSLPTAKDTLDGLSVNSLEPITSRMHTGLTCRLGTSMPTVAILSGMGATRTATAPRDRAMSSDRLVILFSFTPWSSSSSYRVTAGPRVTLTIWASTPKDCSASWSRCWLACSSPAAAAPAPAPSFSRDTGG